MTATAETEAPKRSHRLLDSWRFPVLLFVVVCGVLSFVVQTSHDHLDPAKPAQGPDMKQAFYGEWMQWDAGWYVKIAEHGYSRLEVDDFESGRQSAVAYFPMYPLTVRQVAHFTDDNYWLAAEITTVVSGLAVLLLFWTWCGRRLSAKARRAALILLALYPYAWFLYGGGYGDALFIAFAISAFLLVERDRPVLGGLFGAAASATRLIGVGVIIGLIALTIERRGVLVRRDGGEGKHLPWAKWKLDRSRLRPSDAGVLLSAGGILSYSLFLWQRTGDLVAWNTVQGAPGWDQGTGPKTWLKYSFFAQVRHGNPSSSIRLVVQALLCLLVLIALPWVWKRIGAPYAIYTGVIVVIPLIGSSSFQGFGRYLLGAFPVFALGGQVLAERALPRRFVLGFSAIGLIALASLFGRGYYLS